MRAWWATTATSTWSPTSCESFEVHEGRVFTLKLRKGHRWSDGQPFTTEDFRYYWEDVANNKELSPAGPPRDLLVEGQPPKFEVLSETEVRYTWHKPNPHFLPRLAGASPLFIYRPAHYLKPLHKKYSEKVRKSRGRGHGEAQLVGGAQPRRQPVRVGQPRPADAAALDEHHQAAGRPLRRRAQSLLPPRRPERPAASLHRPLHPRGGRSEADPGQDRRRRSRPAGARRALQQLHLPQAGREAERLPHAALAAGQGLAFRAVSEPERERPGVARGAARRALPPRAVARHRPLARQPGAVLRPGHRVEQHRAAAEPAVPRGLPRPLGALRQEASLAIAGPDGLEKRP